MVLIFALRARCFKGESWYSLWLVHHILSGYLLGRTIVDNMLNLAVVKMYTFTFPNLSPILGAELTLQGINAVHTCELPALWWLSLSTVYLIQYWTISRKEAQSVCYEEVSVDEHELSCCAVFSSCIQVSHFCQQVMTYVSASYCAYQSLLDMGIYDWHVKFWFRFDSPLCWQQNCHILSNTGHVVNQKLYVLYWWKKPLRHATSM